jgi:rhomboid protease GluP
MPATSDRLHVSLDAPVTLLWVGGAAAATLLPDASTLLRLDPIGPVALMNPRWYLGLLGHVFAHANIGHLIGNASLLLLLAPGLEKRMGSGRFAGLMAMLTLLTGLSASGILFFTRDSLIGASGLVFALIFLHSMAGSRHREIPVTTLLLAVLWGSKEILGLFDGSHVSNSAHLNGAFWGLVFGLFVMPKSGGGAEGAS